MAKSHEISIEQCEAARDIREALGLQKALGYLIGEKLLNFLRAADEDPAFAGELPRFVEEIKQIFDRAEIQTYLDTVHRVGALAHTASDEAYEEMREAGAISCRVGRGCPPDRAREEAPAGLTGQFLSLLASRPKRRDAASAKSRSANERMYSRFAIVRRQSSGMLPRRKERPQAARRPRPWYPPSSPTLTARSAPSANDEVRSNAHSAASSDATTCPVPRIAGGSRRLAARYRQASTASSA